VMHPYKWSPSHCSGFLHLPRTWTDHHQSDICQMDAN
jgi:hypothetical protein